MLSFRLIGKSFLSASFMLIAFSSSALAQSVYFTTPTKLEITVKKFELCSDTTCTSPVTLGSGDVTFDIASQSSGADIGNYASNASIPRGVTFPYARLTIDRTFTITGAANVPGAGSGDEDHTNAAACHTKTGNPNTGAAEVITTSTTASTNLASAVSAATAQSIKLAEGDPPEGDVLISEVYTENTVVSVHPLATPLRLDPNSAAPEIAISIDALNAMSFYRSGANCFADEEPPTISITVN